MDLSYELVLLHTLYEEIEDEEGNISENIIKEDIETRKLVPNVLTVAIQEAFNDEGNIYKDRFWVEEEGKDRVLVKGKYDDLLKHRKALLSKTNIGFHGKSIFGKTSYSR